MVGYEKGKYRLTVPEVEQIIDNYNNNKFENKNNRKYVPLYLDKVKKFDYDLFEKLLRENKKLTKKELAKLMACKSVSTMDNYLKKWYGTSSINFIKKHYVK